MTAGVGGALMDGVMSTIHLLGLRKAKQVMGFYKCWVQAA